MFGDCPSTKSAASVSPMMLASAHGVTLPLQKKAPPKMTSSCCEAISQLMHTVNSAVMFACGHVQHCFGMHMQQLDTRHLHLRAEQMSTWTSYALCPAHRVKAYMKEDEACEH